MVPLVLIVAGTAVFGGTFLAARLTSHSGPMPDDLWAAPTDELERGRPRVWPVVSGLGGLVLVAGGLVGVQTTPAERLTDPDHATARPTLIEVRVAGLEATPDPSPEPTPDAAPSTPAPVSSAAQTPAPVAAPQPAAPAPTPAPTPKPGPEMSTSANCTDGNLWIGYSVSAREQTTLETLVITGAGETHSVDGVSGASRHSGTWQRSVEPGDHTVTITATASDGGRTQRTHQLTC